MSPWPFSKWGIDLLGPFPLAAGQVKYLIVIVDYFTKWIEVEPLSSITAQQAWKFFWWNTFTRFGISNCLITDNGTQFTDHKIRDFLSSYKVEHHFTSVEHSQANGQVEAANKVILRGLKKRLNDKKGSWANELGSVLWSYRTTSHSTTGETPFKLTYGVDAMIPIEVGEPSPRVIFQSTSFESIREEIDLSSKAREMTHNREKALKQRVAKRYNSSVVPRKFEEGVLVLQQPNIGQPTPGHGKLAANMEGPYKIVEVLGKGAYNLSTLSRSSSEVRK